MKRLLVILFSLLLCASLWAVEDLAQFEFLVQNKRGNLQDLSRLGYYQVASGDRFQFHVTTPTQGAAYVFHLPSEGGIEYLGPHQTQMTFPGPRQWFSLDKNPGVEEFFVIFTPTALPDLESLLSTPGKPTELLTWVKEFRGRTSRIAGQSRQSFAAIAGPVRAASGSGIVIPLNDTYAFSVILGR